MNSFTFVISYLQYETATSIFSFLTANFTSPLTMPTSSNQPQQSKYLDNMTYFYFSILLQMALVVVIAEQELLQEQQLEQ